MTSEILENLTDEISDINIKLSEEEKFIKIINKTYKKYFKYGPRSSKKVNYFHEKIKSILKFYFTDENGFEIITEYNILSCNSKKNKKCDIVVLKNKEPYIIFPVKVIMTNYKQNRNNSWENLTGELVHIKWCNNNINLIPINIFMDKTPYLKKNKKIKYFENVTIRDIENYNELVKHNICYDMINYIVEVDHVQNINEEFKEIKPIIKFITKYREFNLILNKLL